MNSWITISSRRIILIVLVFLIDLRKCVQPQNTSFECFAEAKHTTILSGYIGNLITGLGAMSVFLYYDKSIESHIVENIVFRAINAGSSLEYIISYHKHLPITPVTDTYVNIFHINILHGNRTDDINLSYLNTSQNTSDKYNSHFILVFDAELDKKSNDWMIPIFNVFWEHNIFHVLIVFWECFHKTLRVFTFNPFVNEHFIIEMSSNRTQYSDLFWDKAANLNQHTLRVSLFAEKTRAIFNPSGRMSGTDGHLTELMVEMMNASLLLLPPQDGFDIGEFLKNGSYTGSLAQIINGHVDISVNTRLLRLNQFRGKVEITYTIGRDDICFLVAKAGYSSNLYNLFLAFSTTVWIMIFVSPFIATVSYSVVYKLQNESRELSNTFFNFLSWILGQPIMRKPAKLASKMIIASWVLYALVITSSYVGQLTSNLVLRPMLPDINTIRQLDDSKLEILTFGRYVDLIVRFLNQTTAYDGLESRIKSVSTAADLERHIYAHKLSYAYANKQHINDYLSKRMENHRDGRPVFHNVPECPVPYLVAYALPIGSPYLARINTILRRVQENGMISYWDQQVHRHSSGEWASNMKSSVGLVPLSLHHLQSAFYILCFGLILAATVLAAELRRLC